MGGKSFWIEKLRDTVTPSGRNRGFRRSVRAHPVGNLAPYVTRIQASRHRSIRCALDDRPAIREERHLERIFPKLKHKLGMANPAVWLQSLAHVAQIDGPGALVNLDRIPAAHGDVGTSFARQVGEFATSASSTVSPRHRRRNLCPLIAPQVLRKQGTPEL